MTATEKQIDDEIKALGDDQQAAFAAICAERMLPMYAQFSREVGWGDIDALNRGLDAVWASITGAQSVPRSVRERCESAAPDDSDFNTELVDFAMDAAASVVYAIDTVTGDRRSATVVARLSQQTADAIALLKSGGRVAATHAPVQAELQTEHAYVNEVRQHTSFDSGTARALRDLARRAQFEVPREIDRSVGQTR